MPFHFVEKWFGFSKPLSHALINKILFIESMTENVIYLAEIGAFLLLPQAINPANAIRNTFIPIASNSPLEA